MKLRTFGTTALLALCLSGVATAQQADVDPLSKLDIQSRRQIQNLIDSARLADLPWNALRLKAVQGVSLKVEGKRVVAVVRDLYKSLQTARVALGPLATAEEVETGASLLAAHVSVEDLAKFRVTTVGRSPTRAMTYLADLIDKRNIPQDEAVAAFSKLWKEGANDSDFDGLWRLVDQDILSGLSPRAALQTRMRSLPPRTGKPPADMEMEETL
jgi:hypothetical protein